MCFQNIDIREMDCFNIFNQIKLNKNVNERGCYAFYLTLDFSTKLQCKQAKWNHCLVCLLFF